MTKIHRRNPSKMGNLPNQPTLELVYQPMRESLSCMVFLRNSSSHHIFGCAILQSRVLTNTHRKYPSKISISSGTHRKLPRLELGYPPMRERLSCMVFLRCSSSHHIFGAMDRVCQLAIASTEKYPSKIPIQNEYFVGYPSKVPKTRATLSADARKMELHGVSSLFYPHITYSVQWIGCALSQSRVLTYTHRKYPSKMSISSGTHRKLPRLELVYPPMRERWSCMVFLRYSSSHVRCNGSGVPMSNREY